MRLLLNLDGGVSVGYCGEHGHYSSTWERVSLDGVSGVLACVCPVCRHEKSATPTLALPDQSLAKLAYQPWPSPISESLRIRLPLLVLDALDLACHSAVGSQSLSELRAEHIFTEALAIREHDPENIADVLLGIAKAALPIESLRMKTSVRLRFQNHDKALLIRNLASAIRLPLTSTILGLALFAWVRADEKGRDE